MKIIDTEKHVIKSWCENPEEGAIVQAKNLANLPFIFKHVALMPDCHQGYGMPIGGVIACKDVIIINCIGVDIGCGMAAVKTNLTEISKDILKKIMNSIREKIPLGFNHHQESQDENLMPTMIYKDGICKQEYKSALTQLGTLGGGNHFLEVQKGSDGFIWFMVHSGSRNLGYRVAKEYNKIAQKLCKLWYSNIPEPKGEDGLAFLPIGTEEARHYLEEMKYCLSFALANRSLMIERIKESFIKNITISLEFQDTINIHHNYVALENHFGQNVWIHRKGATSAKEGEIGLIPGSQGTCSYVVKGKGNPESFMSCSHGAGRKMGRNEARKTLNLEAEIAKLESKGIIHGIRSQKNLDEASGSYKDIEIVMEEQKDLVDILVKLEPLAVIKGD